MNSAWTTYDNTTGLMLPGRVRAQNISQVLVNTPTGFSLVEGEFDYLSQKVDLSLVTARQSAIDAAQADLDAAMAAIAAASDDATMISARALLVAAQASMAAAVALSVVVDYVPSAPADTALATYAWDTGTKRWVGTPTLLAIQQSHISNALVTSYVAAIDTSVSFTTSGAVTKTYQTDQQSLANLTNMLLAFGGTGVVPGGFYWVSEDNTQVPFTYADLQGLALAMGTMGFAAFDHLQTKKDAVLSASSAGDVYAITW